MTYSNKSFPLAHIILIFITHCPKDIINLLMNEIKILLRGKRGRKVILIKNDTIVNVKICRLLVINPFIRKTYTLEVFHSLFKSAIIQKINTIALSIKTSNYHLLCSPFKVSYWFIASKKYWNDERTWKFCADHLAQVWKNVSWDLSTCKNYQKWFPTQTLADANLKLVCYHFSEFGVF